MDFELSDEQAMLRTAWRDLLADHAPIDVVRAEVDHNDDVDPMFWRLAAGLGWAGLAVPEEYGGTGRSGPGRARAGRRKRSAEVKSALVQDAAFPNRMYRTEEYAKLVLAIVDNPMLNGQCLRFAPR